jgi:ribosomal protein S4
VLGKRFDSVVVKLGICRNITVARRLIKRSKLMINGKVANDFNIILERGDLIQTIDIPKKSRKITG